MEFAAISFAISGGVVPYPSTKIRLPFAICRIVYIAFVLRTRVLAKDGGYFAPSFRDGREGGRDAGQGEEDDDAQKRKAKPASRAASDGCGGRCQQAGPRQDLAVEQRAKAAGKDHHNEAAQEDERQVRRVA